MSDYEQLASTVEQIAFAAIDAHMRHLDFQPEGGVLYRALGHGSWTRDILVVRFVDGQATVDLTEDAKLDWAAEDEGTREGRQQYMESVAQELSTDVFAYYPAEIYTIFNPWFGIPDAAGFDGQVRALAGAADTIRVIAGTGGNHGALDNRLAGALNGADGCLEDLEGEYVESFYSNYWIYVPGTIQNNTMLIDALRISATASQEAMRPGP